MRAGFVPAPLTFLCSAPFGMARYLALAAVACLLVAACSPGVEYPSIFPAVHDMPPPRAETPMDQVQVQKATEDLITQRDHLNAGAPPSTGQAKAATNPAASSSANQTANSTAVPAVKKRAAAGKAKQAGAAPPATTASAQTAGADPKP
jgi:hypothetical protein